MTGCAGFIGAAVSERLLREGQGVIGVDNLNSAYDPRLKTWRLKRLREMKGFRFHHADVTRPEEMEPLFAAGSVDAVINLAARAGVRQSIQDPHVYEATNATGTLQLLELCRTHDVGRFVLASTSSLYGSHNPRPFREDADTNRPLSPYAATKKAAEAFVATYSHLYGLDAPVLRFFTVYGPAGRPDMSLFRFVRWIVGGEPVVLFGDGTQERDFTHVEDVARGTVAALGVRGFEVVNLGSDHPVALNDLIALIEEAAGRRALIHRRARHAADVQATWADIHKARRLLGWEPRVPLAEGIRGAVEWYRENRSWARELDLGVI